jgi:ABC-2 type transport system permease protein
LTIAVYDPGGSSLVTELQTLSLVTIKPVASEQMLPEEVKKSAVGGLVIPVGFDMAVRTGEKPELDVYINRRRGGGEIAAFQQLIDRQVWSLIDQESPARIVWTDVGTSAGFQGEFRFQRIMLVMFLVMALGMTGTFMVPTLLVEEKEKHTLDSLLISPAGPKDIAAGKALTGMSYSLLCAGVLIAMNQGWVGNWFITFVTLVLGSPVVMVGC